MTIKKEFENTEKDIQMLIKLSKSGYGPWLIDYLERRVQHLDRISNVQGLEEGQLAARLLGHSIAIEQLEDIISDLKVESLPREEAKGDDSGE